MYATKEVNMKLKDLEKQYKKETGCLVKSVEHRFCYFADEFIEWLANKVPKPNQRPIVKGDFLVLVDINKLEKKYIRCIGYADSKGSDSDWLNMGYCLLQENHNIKRQTYRIDWGVDT